MSHYEILFFWVTVFFYVGAFCLLTFSFVRQKEKGGQIASSLLLGGLIIHTITLVIRWMNGGHPPVTDVYELNLTGTWFTVILYLLFLKLEKLDKQIGIVVIPITFLLMGYGYMARTEAMPMGPAFQSPWLVVHVIFAWLAFGCYAIATGTSSSLLFRNKIKIWKPNIQIPEDNKLDDSSYRFVILGFINHAVMLVSGSIWAKKLWGHYWSWDALETWSLIAFLYYAFYLHTRSFLGWKMRKAAWLTIFGLIVLAISYWGVSLFGPTVHPGP